MKIIIAEEPGDLCTSVVSIAKALAFLKRGIKVTYTLYLVTDRQQPWELAETMGVHGIIKRTCLREELFDPPSQN